MRNILSLRPKAVSSEADLKRRLKCMGKLAKVFHQQDSLAASLQVW